MGVLLGIPPLSKWHHNLLVLRHVDLGSGPMQFR